MILGIAKAVRQDGHEFMAHNLVQGKLSGF